MIADDCRQNDARQADHLTSRVVTDLSAAVNGDAAAKEKNYAPYNQIEMVGIEYCKVPSDVRASTAKYNDSQIAIDPLVERIQNERNYKR
ncbi:MAG: hypothetical protein KDA78_05640 [Planctomycetaceae bacterium]|nr:hypothetical protein [Planctomycetaceae bacterium]